ncbi:uncharacterized protein LOC128645261 isoform X2 [Bombina bombina]|uniref:uncharacterized protein LOC128645261 isoform X2 n=1 Tax=Bombina bombina TaxID=8345 RepID=UPI00235A8B0C|nr:uncharacterized protein LOC128645261 isoform X2 [Bombina bombina]
MKMDVLENFLTGHEDDLLSFTSSELEKCVRLLSDKVQAEKDHLEQVKSEVLNLQREATESSEREKFVSLLTETGDLDSVLSEEAKTWEELHAASLELERMTNLPESSEADITMGKPDLIPSTHQKEKQLLSEREKLWEILQKTQAALAKAQMEKERVDDELLALQKQSSGLASSRSQTQNETDRLLEACIKDMGLLRVLPDLKPKIK